MLRNDPQSAVIAATDGDKPMAQYFSTLLRIPTGTAPPDLPPGKLGQVTIMLGKDYTYTPMQDLVPLPPDIDSSGSSSSTSS